MSGVSASGSNVIRIGWSKPDRIIACIGHHGRSIVGMEPPVKDEPLSPKIPILYTMAQLDITRNFLIEPHIRDTLRIDYGCPMTTILHMGEKHNSTGADDVFELLWLEHVINLRLENGKLKPISIGDSYGGTYDLISPETHDIHMENASITSDFQQFSNQIWLPNSVVANAWVTMHGGTPNQD